MTEFLNGTSKTLSISKNPELTTQCEAFIATLPEEAKPANTKELLQRLLEKAGALPVVDTTELSRLSTELENLKQEQQEYYQKLIGWINPLIEKLKPYLPADKQDPLPQDIAIGIDRLLFINSTLNKEFTEYKATVEKEKSEAKPLGAGQCLCSFTDDELKEIRLLRLLLQKMGHRFKSAEPAEVIAKVNHEYLSTIKQQVAQLKHLEPLLSLLNIDSNG